MYKLLLSNLARLPGSAPRKTQGKGADVEWHHKGHLARVCFVYDPEFRIGNPAEIEDDLTGKHDRLDVRVLIAPNTD